MRRLLSAMLLYVFIGVTVNVGVMWGLLCNPAARTNAARNDRVLPVLLTLKQRLPHALGGDAPPAIEMRSTPDPLETRLRKRVAFGCVYDGTARVTTEPFDPAAVHTVAHLGVGWPAIAFRAPYDQSATVTELGLRMRPIALGFAVNVAVYALMAWVLLHAPAAPRAARRYFRHRRGLCIACGYPCGSGSVCPECGSPLPAGAGRQVRDNP